MKQPLSKSLEPLCACGSGLPRGQCCGRWLDGEYAAPTAHALMRSRYVAFVEGNESYLLQSWHSSTRPDSLDLTQDPVQWTGLTIEKVSAGAEGDTHGTVSFIARYKSGGRACRLAETSRFVCEDGRWYYVDGTFD